MAWAFIRYAQDYEDVEADALDKADRDLASANRPRLELPVPPLEEGKVLHAPVFHWASV